MGEGTKDKTGQVSSSLKKQGGDMGAIGARAEVWGNSDIQGLILEAVDLALQHTHTFILSLSLPLPLPLPPPRLG